MAEADFDAAAAKTKQDAAIRRASNVLRVLTEKVVRPYEFNSPASEDQVSRNKAEIRYQIEWTIDELRALLRDL